ncbi:hypothetical protein ABE525_25450 [Pseudomonas wadenswilerensis]|uniref:hypothetical protein n=1 Tax=Pseudomonas wadenswilerensis TaxID=1785161 RepID=UPI00320B8438
MIAFEECWPLSTLLRTEPPTIHILKSISSSVKNKDAAGLGSLGYAYSIGDRSATNYCQDDLAVRIVAAGLNRPDAFFKWAICRTTDSQQALVIDAAATYFKRATWPWDKAFTIAASYLAFDQVPLTQQADILAIEKFPYWIAIDKHTPEGKNILKNIAYELNIPAPILSWISFYMESAVTNSITESPWWGIEKKWRLARIGITELQANKTWHTASALIKDRAKSHVVTIEELLDHGGDTNTLF